MSRWIRNFFRTRTNRIGEDQASKWNTRFSVLYFLVAWNGLAFAGYQYYNRDKLGIKIDDETFAEKMARRNPEKNVTVFKFNNLSHVKTESVSNKERDKSVDGELLQE